METQCVNTEVNTGVNIDINTGINTDVNKSVNIQTNPIIPLISHTQDLLPGIKYSSVKLNISIF